MSAFRRWPRWIAIRTVEQTSEGRPIEAAVITDSTFDDKDKQNVLIVAGQHGNEETSRRVALRLVDYLLSEAGRPLLRRQKIVVIPNVSPDAAEHNTYETPAGIRPNLDHGPGGPTCPESRAVAAMGEWLRPEVYVDMHARGHSGWSHDMVLYPPTQPYTEDEQVLHSIAQSMAAAGEKSGIPHVVHPLSWPGWGGTDLEQPSSTLLMYRRYKSLVLLTENAEADSGSYPESMRARSGLNRLKALLAMGMSRPARQAHAGYPATPVIGMDHAGAIAIGATAAARRASRVACWQNRARFTSLSMALPEQELVRKMLIDYSGPPLTHGIGFQIRVARRLTLRSICVNGRRLRTGKTSATSCCWHDRFTTFAVAPLAKLQAGRHEITFIFE